VSTPTSIMKPVYLDFETMAIGPRPEYPPVPVGLAVYDPEGEYPDGYHAFGHLTGNNTTQAAVKAMMELIYDSGRDICFHNAMFDLDMPRLSARSRRQQSN
jgi:hypothetical protein